MRMVEIGDLEIGVIGHENAFYAYRNLCPHQSGPVCEGVRNAKALELASR